MRDSLKQLWLHSWQWPACRSPGPWPGRLSPFTGPEVNTNDNTPYTPPCPPQKNNEWGTHWSNLGFIVGSDLHADLLGLDLAGFLHALAPLAVDGGEPGAQNSTPQRPLVVLASQLKGKALQHTRNLVNTAQQFSLLVMSASWTKTEWTNRGCPCGGVYVPCIYRHARW